MNKVEKFLKIHGIAANLAKRIYAKYGERAIATIKQNPYRLVMEIPAFDFVTADKLAEKLEFANRREHRTQAGLLYILKRLADDGHTSYPIHSLIKISMETLDATKKTIYDAIDANVRNHHIVVDHEDIYLPKYHLFETSITARLKTLSSAHKCRKHCDELHIPADTNLTKKQKAAVIDAFKHKVLIITGGPGTGKTTIINTIIKIVSSFENSVLLAAPTGRAAKKITDATGHEAQTIHRLLDYAPFHGGFQRNSKNPLDCDYLIIDEASMIDTALMHHLLKAIHNKTTLILVGDTNQLPPVGAGNVLKDIINSGSVHVVWLTEIFRQAETSQIIVNAHKIHSGVMPEFGTVADPSDCYFIQKENPADVLDIIVKLTSKIIPEKHKLNPLEDIQILSPMHSGMTGVKSLNISLQDSLNPTKHRVCSGENAFGVGDKVMQIKNNYKKNVYNGDIGKIKSITSSTITIDFDNRAVDYTYPQLKEITLAYAISVHKSQGSEYPVVIMPILTEHHKLLQRNLIYTALTRARKLVIFVGSQFMLQVGITTTKSNNRHTCLRKRLIKK